jgi:hypothetical protein
MAKNQSRSHQKPRQHRIRDLGSGEGSDHDARLCGKHHFTASIATGKALMRRSC